MNLVKLLFFFFGFIFSGTAFSQTVKDNITIPLTRSHAERMGYTDTLTATAFSNQKQNTPLTRREAELMVYKDSLSGYQYINTTKLPITRRESELMGLNDTLGIK